jgi:chemotaxis protein methyltransferase CheR
MSDIPAADYAHFARLVTDRSGIVLDETKTYLCSTRLGPLAKQLGLPDIAALLGRVRDGDKAVTEMAIEAMTTNETFFFRDTNVWSMLERSVLPDLIERRKYAARLDVWCAASSTGQEPYSLAMLLREKFDLPGWRISITATDLARPVLDRTVRGVYTERELERGIPAMYRAKYFEPCPEGYAVTNDVRSLVKVERLNLIASQWAVQGPFDLILARNVLIYFDLDQRRQIVTRMGELLTPHGYVMLGATESTRLDAPNLVSQSVDNLHVLRPLSAAPAVASH